MSGRKRKGLVKRIIADWEKRVKRMSRRVYGDDDIRKG